MSGQSNKQEENKTTSTKDHKKNKRKEKDWKTILNASISMMEMGIKLDCKEFKNEDFIEFLKIHMAMMQIMNENKLNDKEKDK